MKKIMVVDDEKDQILTVKYTLEDSDENYEIITANSGIECLKILETKTPDLILLDIMMPNMSGWEVYDIIKKNNNLKNIPIIFLTARRDETAEKAGKFFGDDYIEKPYNREDFKLKIKKILND